MQMLPGSPRCLDINPFSLIGNVGCGRPQPLLCPNHSQTPAGAYDGPFRPSEPQTTTELYPHGYGPGQEWGLRLKAVRPFRSGSFGRTSWSFG